MVPLKQADRSNKIKIVATMNLLLSAEFCTWIPGKGVTSEPVAMRMFLVLMTCSPPSAVVAVTWFLPVTLPKPLTWVTCRVGVGLGVAGRQRVVSIVRDGLDVNGHS